ncbi:MAG: hypothetical protein CL797_00950 [Chromatiales bacterium]|jgi:hypothetical protein|nr:hypothetical protein [Chromatiales bacterium]
MDSSNKKLLSAVHFICKQMGSEPEKLGLVKLHKILWYTDVWSFRHTGMSMTGGHYIRMPYGPCLQELTATLKTLKSQGKVFENEGEYFGYEQRQMIGKGTPDTSLLTDREVRLLEDFIKDVCESHTAASISEKSHKDRVWQIAADGEAIPLEATLVRFIPPDPESIREAKQELGIA